nr:DUF3313 family protein [Pseudomonas sp. KU43P]
MQTVSHTNGKPSFVEQVTVEGKMADAGSGEVIAAMIDRRVGLASQSRQSATLANEAAARNRASLFFACCVDFSLIDSHCVHAGCITARNDQVAFKRATVLEAHRCTESPGLQ